MLRILTKPKLKNVPTMLKLQCPEDGRQKEHVLSCQFVVDLFHASYNIF